MLANDRRYDPSRRIGTMAMVVAVFGLLGLAGFVLVQAGFRLGHTFNDLHGREAATRLSITPENSYPCGLGIACFEKGRYRPIWL